MLVGDGREVVVIDAASPYEDERARLDAHVDALARAGQRVREVVLTHHHHDHSSGAEHLARRLGVPVAAHARTAARLAGRVSIDRAIEDGELLDLPADREGARPRRLRAHLLEGHADGHLVFQEEVTGDVIAGDMVAGTGTIVIDPPEGDMGRYLESLARLKALRPRVLFPAHGPPIGDPAGLVDRYVAHRLDREAKVLAAVAQGAAQVEDLVPRAYTDVAPALYPLAARSLLAHLLKLERDGRVARAGEAWALA
jgi:glyoxylase-like metal-dependent hydrolase (beta-lactamase superfamily II)